MNIRDNPKWMKLSTVLGCMLTLLPTGLFLYWGNMSTYCLSYIVNVADSTANISTPWVISAYLVFLPLGVGSANFVANMVGRRCSLLIGIICSNVGLFSSYFTVQISVLALTSTVGILLGFGTGLTNGSCLQLVLEWADKDVGKLTAVLQCAFPIGAMVINQFMTLLINPEGYVPKMTLGRVKYFAQNAILGRVPLMFLVLGAVSVSINFLGLMMIRQRPKEEVTVISKLNIEGDGYSTFSTEFVHPKDSKTKDTVSQSDNHISASQPQAGSVSSAPAGDIHISASQPQAESVSSAPAGDKKRNDYHPKEMLKTASFYAIWISYAIGDLPLLLFTNYYKFFGQMWIENDLMLSVLGTVIIVFNGLASVTWGSAMDKFGVKNCLAFLMSADIIIMSWYYFTPMVHEWLYFVVTLLFGCFADSLYPCFTVGTALLYGKTHFSTNFGIVMTANVFLNIIAPNILEGVLSQFGFVGLFSFAASTTIISLILILIFIPRI